MIGVRADGHSPAEPAYRPASPVTMIVWRGPRSARFFSRSLCDFLSLFYTIIQGSTSRATRPGQGSPGRVAFEGSV
jgi:hypothetical protein